MQKTRKPLVFIVNGYGCHLDTPLGLVYLPRVVRCIDEEKPDLVIFCGGPTQLKTAGGISEAKVMYDFVRARTGYVPENGYALEDSSYTTLENTNRAAAIIYAHYEGNVRIRHFCEATRAANVIMLDRHFLINKRYQLVDSIDDITVETASWERANPFKQVGNLVHNKLAIMYPWLGLAEREHRRRMRRAKEI